MCPTTTCVASGAGVAARGEGQQLLVEDEVYYGHVSNVNSGRSRDVVASGVDGQWLKVLGPSASLDCSLNGKCAEGTCTCNAGWVGRRCERLHLADVEREQLGFSPTTSDGLNMSSWGGSVQQSRKGKWHMYATDRSC